MDSFAYISKSRCVTPRNAFSDICSALPHSSVLRSRGRSGAHALVCRHICVDAIMRRFHAEDRTLSGARPAAFPEPFDATAPSSGRPACCTTLVHRARWRSSRTCSPAASPVPRGSSFVPFARCAVLEPGALGDDRNRSRRSSPRVPQNNLRMSCTVAATCSRPALTTVRGVLPAVHSPQSSVASRMVLRLPSGNLRTRRLGHQELLFGHPRDHLTIIW